jgi:hypothetical protein
MQTDQSRATITLADGAGHTFKLPNWGSWIMRGFERPGRNPENVRLLRLT